MASECLPRCATCDWRGGRAGFLVAAVSCAAQKLGVGPRPCQRRFIAVGLVAKGAVNPGSFVLQCKMTFAAAECRMTGGGRRRGRDLGGAIVISSPESRLPWRSR